MTLTTGLRRGLRALIPLLAIAGLVFTNTAPANAAVIQNKYIQVYIASPANSERLTIKRVGPDGKTTQIIVEAQITTREWHPIEATVIVGERLTVILARRLFGGWAPYKEFVTMAVPANDQQFFWIDTGKYTGKYTG